MKPVLSKKDFVKRYSVGEFGNCSPTWDTFEDLLDDPNLAFWLSTSRFHIRNRIAGGRTWYNIPFKDLILELREAFETIGPSNVYLSAMCPTEKTILQGEIMQTEKGLYLFYSRVDKPMREALKEKAHEATGLKAKLILESALNCNSMDWLNYLLDAYPFHVIEFTALTVEWGTVPGYNTLFWEVRKY